MIGEECFHFTVHGYSRDELLAKARGEARHYFGHQEFAIPQFIAERGQWGAPGLEARGYAVPLRSNPSPPPDDSGLRTIGLA